MGKRSIATPTPSLCVIQAYIRCISGTPEARPLGSRRATIYYTLVWDSSKQPDDAARQNQVKTYRLLFEKMLRNMKKLAEGGTLTLQDKQAPVEF
ncbi:hypothetical protein P8936_15245 [Edaphobacter paludis]|uniref:Uncharacterized protein n=1 Tax=Edaphobacter paludis TaxID=3035702 RepID=A0AAU7CX23_9BACT